MSAASLDELRKEREPEPARRTCVGGFASCAPGPGGTVRAQRTEGAVHEVSDGVA